MALGKALFSSESGRWETPPELFAKLDQEFGFTVDVCAEAHNKKCRRYFSPGVDGLRRSWAGERAWCNPPYGMGLSRWFAKAIAEREQGATVVVLVPARTDTRWWQTFVMPHADEVRFIDGRVKFIRPPSKTHERKHKRKRANGKRATIAPFPSVLVIFRGRP
jgi:site-specific DNA-methyltransferase (adenine-specific)